MLVHERLLRTSEDFVWPVESTFHGRFIIDVEFLDLKVCPTNGREATSIWPYGGQLQSLATESALRCLSRMPNESIHADVTIKTNDGTLWAHKAILSASSPMFHNMFVDNLEEEAFLFLYRILCHLISMITFPAMEQKTLRIKSPPRFYWMRAVTLMLETMKRLIFWKNKGTIIFVMNPLSIERS